MSPIFHARAPVRVDCAGGGTDCPPFSSEHGGAVVNVGISHYAWAEVERFSDASRGVEIISHDFDTTLSAPHIEELPAGKLDLLAAFIRRIAPDAALSLRVRSDVPPGSGLGSSGAVGVACVAALDAAIGSRRPPLEIAQLANEIERVDLGHAGGDQDSLGPAFGGINLLTCTPGLPTERRALQAPPGFVAELERRALLVYTGEPHLSGSIHADIKADYARPDSRVRNAMFGLKAAGERCAQAVERGDIDSFAVSLNENWRHHQLLHESCNCEQLQRYYDAAEGRVIGAKTCGAGGGGCILFLAGDDAARKTFAEDVTAMGGKLLPVRIVHQGVETWSSGGS